MKFEVLDIDIGHIRFFLGSNVFVFFADGEYVCDSGFYQGGERSLWRFDKNGALRYSHHQWRPASYDQDEIEEWGLFLAVVGSDEKEVEKVNEQLHEIIKEWINDTALLG